jgi:DNA-binding transcriptional ArsR family regulator
MGELVVGKPALQLNSTVSLPLDMVSIMSLLYRAVPGSGLDRWLIATRRALPEELRADLDLLHGFSGRMLYYMEEPIMRFEPMRAERANSTFDELITFLSELPAEEYRGMAEHSLMRVHRDLGTPQPAPPIADVRAWRDFVEPALTTATADDVLLLVQRPEELKARTIHLIDGIWRQVYAEDYNARLPILKRASIVANPITRQGFGPAFSELTGNRLPSTLVSGLNQVEHVTFCPSYHLGSFVSYILYPPSLVVFFGAPELLSRLDPLFLTDGGGAVAVTQSPERVESQIEEEDLLEALRALGDPNRMRVIDLLAGGELYAQEIVGRLGIAQSAVSRHLSLLERSGLIRVRPRGGKRYYEVDCARLDAIADAIRCRGRV